MDKYIDFKIEKVLDRCTPERFTTEKYAEAKYQLFNRALKTDLGNIQDIEMILRYLQPLEQILTDEARDAMNNPTMYFFAVFCCNAANQVMSIRTQLTAQMQSMGLAV